MAPQRGLTIEIGVVDLSDDLPRQIDPDTKGRRRAGRRGQLGHVPLAPEEGAEIARRRAERSADDLHAIIEAATLDKLRRRSQPADVGLRALTPQIRANSGPVVDRESQISCVVESGYSGGADVIVRPDLCQRIGRLCMASAGRAQRARLQVEMRTDPASSLFDSPAGLCASLSPRAI